MSSLLIVDRFELRMDLPLHKIKILLLTQSLYASWKILEFDS